MKSFLFQSGIATIALALAFSAHCSAQEPSARTEVEDLRREVAELRMAVLELTKRLEGQEYQQLPRVESTAPRRAMADMRIKPLEPEVPKYFRFPFDIERGTAVPVMLKARDRWLR